MAQIVQAGGIVLLDRGVVLRRTAKGEWVFPKGNVEEGELLLETALREVAEETGLRCQILFKAGGINYLLGDDEYLVHLFAMEAREKSPSWRYHEGRDAFLFPPEEALERVTFSDTRVLLEKVLLRLDRLSFPAGRRGSPEDGV
jgi:8-oxo-dGTP pyrophosphatase MutT (NUDIX family)